MAALEHQSTLTTVPNLPDAAYETESDDDDLIETRQQKLDRLAREYDEEMARAAAAAAAGEGCLLCSS